MTQTREQMVENLHRGICEVVFTKMDGSQRKMRCTLNETYLPKREQVLNENAPPRTGDNIVVWDVEAGAFRSFRPESVSSFNASFQILNG
jgi:hypothetical protein